MSVNIFYSWQSDSPKKTNRNFIEAALTKAIAELKRDAEIQPALRDEGIVLDKDTKDVPGTPPIFDTILSKISGCRAFVADLTFVGDTEEGRRLPNPNVLIEYGWALKAVGHRRFVPVMNTAFGDPEGNPLPFDLRHLKRPITYHLSPEDDAAEKSRVKADLAKQLADALRLILRETPDTTKPAQSFVEQPSTTNPSTFFQPDEKIGTTDRFSTVSREVFLPSVQRLFLRLVPHEPGCTIQTKKKARDLVQSGGLHPMGQGMHGWFHDRNRYGAFSCCEEEGLIRNISQLFMTGEIWGIDAYSIDAEVVKRHSTLPSPFFASSLIERVFLSALQNYLPFARDTLGLTPPVRLMAGATDVEGYAMCTRNNSFDGSVMDKHIVYESVIDDLDAEPATIILPFFEYFWEECGLDRSQYLGR